MIQDPVFIVGTERSGSNLLRLILNEHESISIPHPPHLMRDLSPLVARYGDLARDRNFKRLIADAVRLVELHFAPWDVKLDRDEIFNRAIDRRLYCVYAEIYGQYLRARGKRRWGCKSTFMIHHVGEIVKYHSNPKIIHLVRDGRDVAVSARSSVFNRFHPHYVAELWRDEQRLAAEWQQKLSPQVFLTLRYEHLIEEPEKKTREVCAFLGETYSPRMLKYFESRSAVELAALSSSWQNVAQPVLRSNSGKYRNELAKEDIFEFERVAWDELRYFGYPLENEVGALRAAQPSAARLVSYFLMEKKRAVRVQLRALLTDGNEFRRWKKRLYLLKLFCKYG